MRFIIRHETRSRLRVHIMQNHMSCREADILQYSLAGHSFIKKVIVQKRTQDVIIYYEGERENVISVLRSFKYDRAKVQVPEDFLENSGRELNEKYKEKLIKQVLFRYGTKFFLPYSFWSGLVVLKSIPFVLKGFKTLFKGKLEVPVLDATAISVLLMRGDVKTASSVMFLLRIGEILEEWTHKKSVDDLARSMSLNIDMVWLEKDGQEVLVPSASINPGDVVITRMGNIIPFDGIVCNGEGMVNQASLTGETVPVHKYKESYVYAGTVLEEGELAVSVDKTGGDSRFERITAMIEESEKLKSSTEGKAEHLADRLVPYMLAGTGIVCLLTRNITKALSVLMVDFSCALKLAIPVSVLSAIREAGGYHITVKGGKFLEAVAEADTIVFDKTGTLTKAEPVVVRVESFNGQEPDELLRIAACLEEHFPHSMARAVVDAARKKKLEHEEMHSELEYIVAHGISSKVGQQKVVIGSCHFVFEDEGCTISEEMQEKFDSLPEEYSHLYMAVDSVLAAVICIEDPLREEAKDVVNALKHTGIKKVVMMTGDSKRIAYSIAQNTGVDTYYAEVLPEDKAKFIEEEKQQGHKVIMIGDGINDSPALSAADAGIAISSSAGIAREIADITIEADNLYGIVTLKEISDALVKRIHTNYKMIVGFNAMLIMLGLVGVLPPELSALLHNTSTVVIGVKSMSNLLD